MHITLVSLRLTNVWQEPHIAQSLDLPDNILTAASGTKLRVLQDIRLLQMTFRMQQEGGAAHYQYNSAHDRLTLEHINPQRTTNWKDLSSITKVYSNVILMTMKANGLGGARGK